MAITLGTLALALFLVYSLYFSQIIRGQASQFERDLLKAFAAWMVERGPDVKRLIWLMALLSFVVEVAYFVLVFVVIKNVAMQYITSFFAGLESFHALLTIVNFRNFFGGFTKMGQMFNWKMERISAVFFFTHTLLVIIILIYY